MMLHNKFFCFLLFCSFTILFSCKGSFKFSSGKSNMVAVDTIKRRIIEEKVNAQGTIFSQTEIKVSSEVSGEIIFLKIKEGDWVKEGQLLVEINPSIYKTQIDQSQAQMNQMKANLSNVKARSHQLIAQFEISQTDFNRQEGLYKKGVISEQEFNQTKNQFLQTKGEKEAALENINASSYQVENATAS